MRTSFLVVAALLTAACTQTDTDGVENAAGSIHKVRPTVKGAAVGPNVTPRDTKNLDRAFDIEETKPRDTKNLDRAFDIEETKPRDTKTLDRAFDIEELKPANAKNLDRAFDIEESKPLDGRGADRAFDIEESKPANLNRSKLQPGGATPGARPGSGKTVPRG